MGNPKRILSVDVPGGREGGYVLANHTELYEGSLVCGPILFTPEKSLTSDFLVLANLLDWAKPQLIILERPFLYQISGYIGGIMMACAERKIGWWQIGPSKAKKLVLGRGKASKEDVLKWAREVWKGKGELTQHSADALLYYEAWREDPK